MADRFLFFGLFEVDLSAGELRKRGRLIHVQQQPFEVLRALLLQPNDIVTREALRDRLWPGGITVDFDQGLNKSITRLRSALGDSAENPRFIETLPKRGYRFIAPISEGRRSPSSTVADVIAVSPPTPPALAAPVSPREPRWWSPAVVAPVAVMAILVALLLAATRPPDRARPLAVAANADAQDAYVRARAAMARRSDEALRNRALALIGAGKIDEAVASLEAAFATRVAGVVHLAADPMWDNVRDHPRVRAMIAEMSRRSIARAR